MDKSVKYMMGVMVAALLAVCTLGAIYGGSGDGKPHMGDFKGRF